MFARELDLVRRHWGANLDDELGIEAAPAAAHRERPQRAVRQREQTMVPAGAELSCCVLTAHGIVTICVDGRTQNTRPPPPLPPLLPVPLPLPPCPPASMNEAP